MTNGFSTSADISKSRRQSCIPSQWRSQPFKTHHNALDMPLYLRMRPVVFEAAVVGG
jgi:hypothetical protein